MNDGLKTAHRNAIIDAIAANPRVERAVLFGSRAMGSHSPESDVDIALFGDELTLDDQAKLAATAERLPMAQRVDFLIGDRVTNESLKAHIDSHGVEWFRREKFSPRAAKA